MQKSDWMKAMLVAVGLCLAALGSYAQDKSASQQTGDPVADAARKAREEKQKKTRTVRKPGGGASASSTGRSPTWKRKSTFFSVNCKNPRWHIMPIQPR